MPGTPDVYKRFGLLKPDEVQKLAGQRVPYLIENVLPSPSINIFVGHSGLGKTAFAAQLGMAVAANIAFLGNKIMETGPVVYCDAESTPAMMTPMCAALAGHLGLDTVPSNFVMWNPTWQLDPTRPVMMHSRVRLYEIVRTVKPKLVVLDSLRNFFPMAIQEQDQAARMIREMRKLCGDTGCSWLLVHHLRKTNREERANNTRPTIRSEIMAWIEEAAGTLALVNNTDARLGWEQDRSGNLWFGGFLRLYGVIGPYKMIRELDEEGEPIGYAIGDPIEQLPRDMQVLFGQLPLGQEFSFNYLVDTLRKSRGTSSRFIRRCRNLGLIAVTREVPREDGGRPLKMYAKIVEEADAEDSDSG
jgi:hypothetical protein